MLYVGAAVDQAFFCEPHAACGTSGCTSAHIESCARNLHQTQRKAAPLLTTEVNPSSISMAGLLLPVQYMMLPGQLPGKLHSSMQSLILNTPLSPKHQPLMTLAPPGGKQLQSKPNLTNRIRDDLSTPRASQVRSSSCLQKLPYAIWTEG